MSFTNFNIDKIAEEFTSDAWEAFNEEDLNTYSDLEIFKEEWIDTKTINTNECKEYCEDLGYDIFECHPVFGRPKNWSQAGHNAIYDALAESDKTVKWEELIDGNKRFEYFPKYLN